MNHVRWRCVALVAYLFSSASSASQMQLSKKDAGIFLHVTTENIKKIQSVQKDHEVIGALVLFQKEHEQKEHEDFAALISAKGDVSHLGRAQSVSVQGVIDLDKEVRISTVLRNVERLDSKRAARPVLVLRTQETLFQPENAALSTRKSRTHQRSSRNGSVEVLYLFRIHHGFTRLLRLETKRRSIDGFGGHSVGKLHFVNTKNGRMLEGERQKRLPARRARASQPAKEMLRFRLDMNGFKKVSSGKAP
ncbi:MAG: hypothetical protein GY822_26830 [Deltaproteobacteria bacterium]|nr:hypothetical protein [Deltaproteobacteria bacterium]